MSGDDGESNTRELSASASAAGVGPVVAAVGARRGTGERIGRYEIIEELGAGGMGIVYAATDSVLGRRVALKLVRPERRGEDGGLRLLREAQSLARLSHPNVVAVFDVGTIGDEVFLAMEMVVGQSLEVWARTTRPAPARVIAVMAAAGRGLAAAHAAGIVHRDFKPDNVLIDDHGVVRVSDFGLARPVGGDGAAAEASLLIEAELTQTGAVMGTPGYIAPEQIDGAAATPAADQFSFCVALFELLCGARPFEGHSVEALRTAIAAQAISPAVPEGLPPHVMATIRRGLRVDPAERFASMAELLAILEPAVAPRRWPILLGLGTTAAAVVTVIVVGRGGDRAAAVATTPAAVLQVDQARRITVEAGCEEFPSLTPDGKTVLYDAAVAEGFAIFALDIATGESRRVTHFAGWDYAPAVSPDGTQVAFLRDEDGTRLMIAPLPAVGPVRRVSERDVGGFRPAWSPDGRSVWGGRLTSPTRYDVTTGAMQTRIEAPPGTTIFNGAEGPAGELVAVVTGKDGEPVGLAILASGQEPRWVARGWFAEVAAALPGHRSVLFSRIAGAASTPALVRVGIDGTLEPLPVGAIAARNGLSLTPDGRRAVWSSCEVRRGLATVTAATTGGARFAPVIGGDWSDVDPTAVPGTSLVIVGSDRQGPPELWVVDIDGKVAARRLPTDGARSDSEVSPDGRWVVYPSGQEQGEGIMVVPFDGSAPPRRLTSRFADSSPAVSADGHVYFDRGIGGDRWDVMRVALAGGDAELVVANADTPVVSPDGRTLVYNQDGAGHARDLGTGVDRVVWDKLGSHLRVGFSADGKRIAVIANQELLVIEVATGELIETIGPGNGQLTGVAYIGDRLIVSRQYWEGDLWLADTAVRPGL